jgi:hypothetical protein
MTELEIMSMEYYQIGFAVIPIRGVEKFTKERILTNTVGWTRDEAIFRFDALYGERGKRLNFDAMAKRGTVKVVPVFAMRKEFELDKPE